MIQIPENLIKYAITVALGAAALGALPHFTHEIQYQTIKLIKESHSGSWGKVWIPDSK